MKAPKKKTAAGKAQSGPGLSPVAAIQKRSGKKRQAAQALATELKVLRSAFKEIVEHFCLRVDSRLLEMIRVLEKEQILEEPQVLPSAKVSLRMAEKIRALKLKPNKGRLKEIARITAWVDKISGKMPTQP